MSIEKTFSLTEVKESLSEAFKVIAENQQEKGLLPGSMLVLLDYPNHNNIVGLGNPARVASLLAGVTEAHYKELKGILTDSQEDAPPEICDRVCEAFNEQIETLVAALREAQI